MDELDQALDGFHHRRRATELAPEPLRNVLLALLDDEEIRVTAMKDSSEAAL